jgi:hypothetical protein
MRPNYSPTTFLIQALLPNTNPFKKFEYVGTIAYLSDAEMSVLKSSLSKDANGDINVAVVPVVNAATSTTPSATAVTNPADALISVLGLTNTAEVSLAKRCVNHNNSKPDYGLMHPVWGWGECQPLRKGLKQKSLNWKDYTVNGSL